MRNVHPCWLLNLFASNITTLQGCCSDVVNVVSTSGVEIQCKDLSRKAPLLLTELAITPEGTSFACSTSVDSIHSKVIAIFDRAVTKLQVCRHLVNDCGTTCVLCQDSWPGAWRAASSNTGSAWVMCMKRAC